MTTSGSASGSGTKMNAALLPYFARWRSTQLYDALIVPPTNHFQKGGLLVSSTVRYGSNQVSISAYSLKQLGKRFRPNRLRTSLSFMFACATNFFGGWKYPSSFQCTAIWASLNSTFSFARVFLAMRTCLPTKAWRCKVYRVRLRTAIKPKKTRRRSSSCGPNNRLPKDGGGRRRKTTILLRRSPGARG